MRRRKRNGNAAALVAKAGKKQHYIWIWDRSMITKSHEKRSRTRMTKPEGSVSTGCSVAISPSDLGNGDLCNCLISINQRMS